MFVKALTIYPFKSLPLKCLDTIKWNVHVKINFCQSFVNCSMQDLQCKAHEIKKSYFINKTHSEYNLSHLFKQEFL
jgi:hypothetical protein